jgi:hypothetical protein
MRFMMLLPAPVEALEKCAVPDPGIVAAMRKYDQEMKKAGVLLAEEGLHPTSKGVRIKVFIETKEVIAGFWIIQVKSKEEAVEWAARCPLPECGVIEIRQIFENCDFPPELQEKAAGS